MAEGENQVEDGIVNPLNIKNCVYTKCYCEENVWWLCKRLQGTQLNNADVIFISNATRSVPLWCQKAALADNPVIWDYHVLLALRDSESALIYDLDTTLPFPCTFAEYSLLSFRQDEHLKPQYHRKFRIVRAADYLSHFASDRSHMRKDGGWLATPPSYPPIHSQGNTNNLHQYISMDDNIDGEPCAYLGNVVTLSRLNNLYG